MTGLAVRASRPRSVLYPADASRAFRLTIHAGRGDTYGVSLDETYGDGDRILSTRVSGAPPAQTGRVVDAVLAAVRSSGHASSVLAFSRKAPVRLDEASGVRLALILLATRPVTKHSRVRELVAGINAMSVEETYYWYAKCLSQDGPRARKALRVLLADS